MNKKTKIVATIGPKSEDIKTLKKLFKAGVNVCRQNFSHGDFAEHGNRFENIKKASKESGVEVAILQDLSGPKIRTGENGGSEFLHIKKNSEFIATSKKSKNTEKTLFINYPKLASEIKVGDRILVNDGKITLKVLKKINNTDLKVRALNGGLIRSRRGVNFPDSDISVSSLTNKDKKDLEFGVKLGFDFVALSFVRTAKDIQDLKKLLKKHKNPAKIVAKIETPQAVENFDEILQATDAVMVARGDLAVEVGAEKVPMIQKRIIKKANALGKPVVVATQMLETMIHEPTPTRAEVSDVANAILDGADAVMLSEETAMGEYPEETVKTMAQIASDTEQSINYDKRIRRKRMYAGVCADKSDAVTQYAARIAHELCAKAIVAFTETGTTARMIARYRTKQPVYVISPSDVVLRQMQLSFDVFAGAQKSLTRKIDVLSAARELLLKKKVVKKGDTVVVVSGSIFGKPGETNTLTVINI